MKRVVSNSSLQTISIDSVEVGHGIVAFVDDDYFYTLVGVRQSDDEVRWAFHPLQHNAFDLYSSLNFDETLAQAVKSQEVFSFDSPYEFADFITENV